MVVLIVVLLIMLFLAVWLLWMVRRQIFSICRQLEFLEGKESNMMITGQIHILGMGRMLGSLNRFLDKSRERQREFNQKEQQIADVYTNLSHDIRTPLTSLDGYFQLLETCDEEQQRKRYVAVIDERIRSLKGMLEELFTFTRLKSGGYELVRENLSLNRILKETIFAYYDEWSRQGILPDLAITEQPLVISGDEQALRRVLQNILKNAIDHGGDYLQISLERRGEKSCLTVCNRVNHPEEIDVGQVFERFYKADPARSKNSTGLGLSIAREFVEQMEGEIAAGLKGDLFSIEIRFLLAETQFHHR